MVFKNRAEAGERLAAALLHLKDALPVVFALPRGGVPVAFQVAKALDAPLGLVLVRKIGAPGHQEYGIGAVCDGAEPVMVMDEGATSLLGVTDSYLEQERRRQLGVIEARRRLWLGRRDLPEVSGRTAIVVDDGVATGWTMRAALRSLRNRGAARLVLAVPVAPAETLQSLAGEVEEAVCLDTPSWFFAIGAFYLDFHQLDDSEVSDFLEQAESFGRRRTRPVAPPAGQSLTKG